MSGFLISSLRRLAIVFVAGAMLAACARTQQAAEPVQPPAPVAPAEAPTAADEILGTGPMRVALLVPKSAGGNSGQAGLAFRNAAELAMRDFPDSGLTMAVYDTGDTPEGAQKAASAALSEGARLILGPVFSGSVRAVAPQARTAGVPIVAFSSDASVAAPGVYLLSFLPGGDVERIVSFAAARGRTSFAALLPANAYGGVAEAAFRQAVSRAGGRVALIERYTPEDIAAKAQGLAANATQFDALLIPDGGQAAPLIAETLASAGVASGQVQLLGSGQWDDPSVLGSPHLRGAWFPGPARAGFEDFSQRYQAAYGAAPPRNSTIAYDGTVLAAALVRRFGDDPFSARVLTNSQGFSGVDGVFRFAGNGLSQRGLAIYEVTGTGAQVIDPAPRSLGQPQGIAQAGSF